MPTAITRVRSTTITPYLPIRVLFVLPRPWPPGLQGSLRDVKAWLLAALAGTEWWVHVQPFCSQEICYRGSLVVVSLVVNQLLMLRRFSEVTIAPFVRAETSYAVKSMMMAVPVSVSSHNSTNPASSKVLGQPLFKHFLYSRIIRRFSTTMGGFSFVASDCDSQGTF